MHFSNVLPDERFVPPYNELFCSGLTHTCSGNIRVLVPGAGLGRLAYDIAKLGKPLPFSIILPTLLMLQSSGFTCQGNEFSLFMLLTSSFVLNRFRTRPTLNFRSLTRNNRTESINQHVLHPYIHSFSNIPEASALLREIRIPDVLPSDLPEGSNFSMVAGPGWI